jgi:hypothetical protein
MFQSSWIDRSGIRTLALALPIITAIVCGTGCLSGATYEVGSGQPFTTIASVPSLSPGDIVNIHCGTFNEVRRWVSNGLSGNPIILRGVCPTSYPVIDGNGKDVSGNGGPRGVWQIEGSNYVISNLAFRNARNGNNGAGIRVMNTAVTISNVLITNCDTGIMTSTPSATRLVVQNSEIAFNGTGVLDGLSHNVYLTAGDATFQFCRIHDAVSGENFKSRAHYTALFYNYISDAAESEVEGLDGAETTSLNSNMTMVGNVLISRPDRTLNTAKFINFGQDVGGTHNGTLYLVNNTLIAGSPAIGFLRSSASNSSIVAINNIFFGSNTIVQPGFAVNISGHNNWTSTTAVIPAGFGNTIFGSNPGFINAGVRDYYLNSTAQVRNLGMVSATYVNGAGAISSAVPVSEYVRHLNTAARLADAAPDAGAYEFRTMLPYQAPFVSAGGSITARPMQPATLTGTVLNGGGSGAITVLWQVLSGPGQVSFGNRTALKTSAAFSQPGNYVLTLSASDGTLSDFSELHVSVAK